MCTSFETKKHTSLIDYKEDVNEDAVGAIRKYLNGAVWVESLDDESFCQPRTVINKKSITVKRVSCSCSSLHNCKVHETEITIQTSTRTTSKTEADVTAKERRSSTSTVKSSNKLLADADDEDIEREYKKWVIKKNEEKKLIEKNQEQILKNAEQEKEQRLAQERDNFRRWLENKKKQKLKEQLKKEKLLERDKTKEYKKEHRKQEAQVRYQLWLKRKQEAELERKLAEQMALLKLSEERQRRIQENQDAYKSWLQRSANKQRPVTPGKGLDSLRSCVSITYKNPIPWAPNIDDMKKPVSL